VFPEVANAVGELGKVEGASEELLTRVEDLRGNLTVGSD
jgi:hypothetical protein